MISAMIEFLKLYLHKFRAINLWQKLSIIASILFFAFLFVENFWFHDFVTLQFREIDDVAFQSIIHEVHRDFSAFHFDRIFRMNYFGYGWSFWIVYSVVTYPFYLFGQLTGFFAPLIIMPRMISFAFVAGTAVLVYKILSSYTKDEFLKFLALIFLFSLPAFGSSALVFRTTAQVMFFSALTFYLAIRKENYEKNDLKNIALSAGLCVGTKLSGALILPLVGAIMASRLQWKLNKENLIKAAYFLAWLFLFVTIFSNPMLLLAPFAPKYLFKFLDSLKYYSHMGPQDNSWQNLSDFMVSGYFNLGIAVVLIIIFLSAFFSKIRHKNDFILIAIWLAASAFLLAKMMLMGPDYMVNYFTALGFLFVLSFAVFQILGKSEKVFATIFLFVTIASGHENFDSGKYSPLAYFKRTSDKEIVAKIEAIQEMKRLIPDPNEASKNITVLMDSKAVFPYSDIEKENLIIRPMMQRGLINVVESEIDPDYIVLDRSSIYFLPDNEFEIAVKEMNEVEKLNYQEIVAERYANKKLLNSLLTDGKISRKTYQSIFDRNGLILLQKLSS